MSFRNVVLEVRAKVKTEGKKTLSQSNKPQKLQFKVSMIRLEEYVGGGKSLLELLE